MLEDLKRTLSNMFGWVFTVHSTGLRFFSIALLIAVLFLLFGFRILGILFLLVAGFCAFFFRIPKRQVKFEADEIACPADGTILSIKTEEDPNSVVIRIFMSVFNVHVQRAPINGTVGDIFYHQGQFLFADKPEAANQNERNLIQFFHQGDKERFAHVEQITGAIARRIECWVKPGQTIDQGHVIGLIRFGSQVAVYLPKEKVRVIVKEGQKVEGGNTVLALWK